MGKKKKKKGLPPEAVERIDGAVTSILTTIDDEDAAAVFASAVEGLDGLEAEVIASLSRTRTAPVLQFLYRLLPALQEKALSKAVKKALYSLEQAGLKTEAGIRPAKSTIIRSPEQRDARAWLSAFDPSGARAGLLAVPTQPKGYVAFAFVLSWYEGLLEMAGLRTNAGGLKNIVTRLAQDMNRGLVEVPAEHARLVMAEAAQTRQDQNRSLPDAHQELVSAASHLTPAEEPAIYGHMTPEDVAEVDPAQAARDLLESTTTPVLAAPEELEPFIQKWQEVETSVLVLSEAQKKERVWDVAREAQEAIFPPERLAALKRVFEEMALISWIEGNRAAAESAMATALDLGGHAEALTDPHIIREYMAQLVKAATMGDDVDKDAETAAKVLERTSSGLIIPGGLVD